MKTWFITGGTPGGFGIAYAEAALDRGHRVAITSRRPPELVQWTQPYGDRVAVLPCDVTNAEQVEAAVAAAEERFGGIDVLVNNAGRGWVGSVEGTDNEIVRRIFELNYFGVLTVLRAVLPGMRAHRSGTVVMMSSVAGLCPVPGFGHYAAVKHAVEGLSDTLRKELEPFNIRVMTVEPGSFRTNAYSGFAAEPLDDISDYSTMLEAVRGAMIEKNGQQPGDPVRGAQALLAALDEVTQPDHLVLGSEAFDVVTGNLSAMLEESRMHETLSRGADLPTR